MNNFDGLGILDIITIFSFVIGLQNLDLNIKQNEDLEKHLSQQDEEMLSKIIAQNQAIIEALEELRI